MPLGESMISTLKSNKRIMLDKSKRFKKTLGGYKKSKPIEYNLPKADSKLLKAIETKIKKQHRIFLLKSTLVSVIISLVLVSILFVVN